MEKRKPILPRVLQVLVWSMVVGTVIGTLIGSFGPKLVTNDIEIFNLKLGFKVTNQYVGYPWYLRQLVIVAPGAALAYAMARLAAMLGCAARGEVFSAPASGHLRSFGLWLLLATLGDTVLPILTQLLNQLLQSPLNISVTFNIESEMIWRLFFSTLIMLLARVLSDGYRLAEENRQFI